MRRESRNEGVETSAEGVKVIGEEDVFSLAGVRRLKEGVGGIEKGGEDAGDVLGVVGG